MEPRTAHFIYWVTNFALVIAAISLHEAGFRMWQIFAILAPVVVLFMMVMIYVAPGPRTKPFVERLKRHF